MNSPWIGWWTSDAPVWMQTTFIRLLAAMVLGGLIGSERQWRQRAAGLRTATLVCFGAAAFVDLGAGVLGAHTNSIIAYVVSGVGFLGAGAIMKEGGSIRGLNTAATLWCSAAVGACAGSGQMLSAVYATVLIVTINLALRPISRWIDKKSTASLHGLGVYRLMVTCGREDQAVVSRLVMRCLASRPVILRELRTEEIEGSDETLIEALIQSGQRDKTLVMGIAASLKAANVVTGVEWAETSHEMD